MFSLNKKNILFLLGDVLLICLAVWFAFLLRFEGVIPQEHVINLWGMMGLSLLVCLPAFYLLNLYSLSWSHVSLRDLLTLLKANSLSFLLIGVCLFVFRDLRIFDGFPRSTFIISFFLVFLFTGSSRFLGRIIRVSVSQKGKKEKTLIVGAGDTGEQILRSILDSPESPYSVVGFVDDEEKKNLTLHGVKVLGKIDDIPALIKEKGIEEMIIALPVQKSKETRRAVQKGRENNLKKIRIVPSVTDIMKGEVSFKNLKPIQIEDLLGRDPVVLNYGYIEKFISEKSVLVTGGAGSIGSVLSSQIARFNPKKLVILDNNETGVFETEQRIRSESPEIDLTAEVGDVCNRKKMDFILNNFKPDIVFHAAAYKHVPLMERVPEEAARDNVFGTLNLAELCQKHNVKKFVFISTDKAIKPNSIMGFSKRMGERICQFLNDRGDTKFISVRFGNVLDSRGSVIPIFREQIKRGGPVTVTHPDMRRYFMTIPEACLLVMEAGSIGQGGEVFVLDMGKPVKILDLAREMIKLYGLEPDRDVPIVFSGIRPGEKLFEEILNVEEGVIPTESKKIFKARLLESDPEKIMDFMEQLKKALDNLDREEIINIFKKAIK